MTKNKGGFLLCVNFANRTNLERSRNTKMIKSKEVRIGLIFNAMSLEAWVLDGDEHKPKLRLSLASPEGDDLVYMDMPIKYCPRCGRKLVD